MKCAFCGGKAELLCDSWLGWERMRGKMQAEAPNLLLLKSGEVPIRYRAVHTCDTSLCRACATPAGGMFVRLRNGPRFRDSIDYCPGHDRGDRRREITGLEAEAMRTRWRASARAERERRDPAQQQVELFPGERA